MYIQITTRCNMSCEHCCYSCTEQGEDMSLKTFREALELIGGGSVAIGGGEPTIHPLFWQMLCEAIAETDDICVWLATNGSQTKIAIALAKMAQKGVIGCDLSQDNYHDEIDESVIRAFTDNSREPFDNSPDARNVRNVTGKESNGGRCDFGTDEQCVCPSILIQPDGTIRGCGCEDAPFFGTVFDSQIPEGWEDFNCHKKQEEYELIS